MKLKVIVAGRQIIKQNDRRRALGKEVLQHPVSPSGFGALLSNE
jgi:hypothetical protein